MKGLRYDDLSCIPFCKWLSFCMHSLHSKPNRVKVEVRWADESHSAGLLVHFTASHLSLSVAPLCMVCLLTSREISSVLTVLLITAIMWQTCTTQCLPSFFFHKICWTWLCAVVLNKFVEGQKAEILKAKDVDILPQGTWIGGGMLFHQLQVSQTNHLFFSPLNNKTAATINE